MGRFDYVKYDDEAVRLQAQFKQAFTQLDGLVNNLPKGRASALVLTKLEEAYMWVGKAIRDAQVDSPNRPAPLQEERGPDAEPGGPSDMADGAVPAAKTSSVPWGIK